MGSCEQTGMELTLTVTLLMAGLTLGHWNPLVSVCPGEGSRYGDYKCIHDRTHRVCAKLVDNSDSSCTEVRWNMGTSRSVSFWDITGQQRWNWKQRICGAPNPGDSWCICMWASANIVAEVGCDSVTINCAATDVDYVLNSRYDGGWNLENFKSCLRRNVRGRQMEDMLIKLRRTSHYHYTVWPNIYLRKYLSYLEAWSDEGYFQFIIQISQDCK